MIAAASHICESNSWSIRNQRWLSQRIRFWSERIARYLAEPEGPLDSSLPASRRTDFEPALVRLGASFGLSSFETEVLVLAAGIEIDSSLRERVLQAQGLASAQPAQLSFALALALVPEAHWDALSPLAPLRRWKLLSFDVSRGFTHATMRIDERVLHYLTGVSACDDQLAGIAALEPGGVPDELHELSATIASIIADHHSTVVVLTSAGRDMERHTDEQFACAVFAQLGWRTLKVDASALPASASHVFELATHIDRECALSGAGAVLVMDEDPTHARAATRLLTHLRTPVVVIGPTDLMHVSGHRLWRFDVPAPSTPVLTHFPAVAQHAARRALQQFRVHTDALAQALGSVCEDEDQDAANARLWEALRCASRGGLDALAQRVSSTATFADIVLPEAQLSTLRDIAAHLHHRERVFRDWDFARLHPNGQGLTALFAGESGTGKTLAAEAIANAAGLDLYRVDLAGVVSKYIGETEKNLRRVFDAAEASGAVLLFDEADALFGKRSDVKDSHDRYANIEVAYLLQRVEQYRGLAILTTNMKSGLDRAFLRRLRFVVQFPFPDAIAREQIWRRQFPDCAPLGPIDYRALAQLHLSGGNIRSIALNAAFTAAQRGVAIGHSEVMTSARAEFCKLERTFTPPHASLAGVSS